MGDGMMMGDMPLGFMLLRLVMFLIPPILNCYLASMKNRSVVGWFFIGVFFSYLSTIVIAFLPPKPTMKFGDAR